MKMRTSMIVLLAVFGLSGVALADQASYEAAMADAKAAFDKSNKVGFAWSVAEDAMKEAEKAAKEGNYDKAEALAKDAKQLSETAYKQYEEQKNAGPLF